MMIDKRYDDRLKALIGAGAEAAPSGTGDSSFESLETAASIRPADTLDRVRARLDSLPEEEIVNPEDFQRALAIFTRRARHALESVAADPARSLSTGSRMALEAVVVADGTRPSLLVRDDTVDWTHPLAGNWKAEAPAASAMKPLLQAVGRIEPADVNGRNYFGTGWVVDQAKGLVLTNLHVVETMHRRLPNTMLRTATGFRVLDGAFIDFAAEAGSARTARFKVVEATPSGIDGAGFARLDAAVLRIEALAAGQSVPAAITVSSDLGGARGEFTSHCLIGYPGPAPSITGVSDGVDWNWVNRVLFGGRYGVKRLAPGGIIRMLGGFGVDDPAQWVFGHDATTFGGSSGSAMLAWTSDLSSFGIHFAGRTGAYNCAHALGEPRIRARLAALGVPIGP